jgi:hypothetical protein
MVRRNEKSIVENINISTFKSFKIQQPCNAKYLVVVIDRGITNEVIHVNSMKEAKRLFGKIARDRRYKPSEINASDKYDVSIWEWKENKYEKIYYYS